MWCKLGNIHTFNTKSVSFCTENPWCKKRLIHKRPAQISTCCLAGANTICWKLVLTNTNSPLETLLLYISLSFSKCWAFWGFEWCRMNVPWYQAQNIQSDVEGMRLVCVLSLSFGYFDIKTLMIRPLIPTKYPWLAVVEYKSCWTHNIIDHDTASDLLLRKLLLLRCV